MYVHVCMQYNDLHTYPYVRQYIHTSIQLSTRSSVCTYSTYIHTYIGIGIGIGIDIDIDIDRN